MRTCTEEGCGSRHYGRGLCAKHYFAHRYSGALPAAPPSDIRSRFWAKVNRADGPDACWRWMGRVNFNGYGRIDFEGKGWLAHRVAWLLEHGSLPDGAVVMHACDNPRCVRVEHLSIGSIQKNIQDMDAKGRRRHRTAVVRRDEILSRVAAGETITSVARDLGIYYFNVWRVVQRGGGLARLRAPA